jgi:hypothetical protein
MEENQDAKKIRLQRPAPLLIVALGELQNRRQSASPELARIYKIFPIRPSLLHLRQPLTSYLHRGSLQ